MRLSDNFSLHEFTRSQTATRHNIDNTPNDEVIDNLKSFVCRCASASTRLFYETYDY